MSGPSQSLKLFLTRHAEQDLLDIEEDLRRRIKGDIIRLAKGEIPFAQTKKLHSFKPPIWQLTSGRFRILYRRAGDQLLMLRVVDKSMQRDLFRSLR